MSEAVDDLDALGLMAARLRSVVKFGTTDVGAGLVRGNMTSALNRLATASFVIDFKQSPGVADYFSAFSVALHQQGAERPRFTGSVIKATPTQDGTEIEAVSSVQLLETVIPGMAARGVAPAEMVYVLARSAGIPDEKLKIQGLEALPRETFEVVVPIDGIMVDEPRSFGGISLIPAISARKAIAEWSVQDELRSSFDSLAYGLVLVTAERMLSAETEALAAVELALAWLTVQLRYGLTHLPDGTSLAFDRKESLTRVVRRDVVYVRGLSTLRQWLRRPLMARQALLVNLHSTARLVADVLPELSLQDQLAIKALARVAHESDSLAQIQALWEAIEFYVSGTTAEHIFSSGECRTIRKAILTELGQVASNRLKRIDRSIGELSNPPLLVRLKKTLDDDRVPISDEEIDLLAKLRALRNDVVHGRRSERPITEDVEYAASVVARMIVYRVARCTAKSLLDVQQNSFQKSDT